MATVLSRREKLTAWRQATGRTPMKRLSYVAECASRPRTSCTPLQKNKHSKKHSLSTFKAPPPSSKRMPTKARQNRVDTENAPPCKCGLEESKRVGGLVGESATRPMNKKELRRQMLKEWQALNGRTLKRPPLFGHGAAGNHAAALTKEKSLRQRRHTIGGNAIHNSSNSSRSRRSTRGRKDQGEGAPRQFSRDERETLKEQFLREIALEYEDDLETTKFEAREGEIEEEREEEEEEKEEGLARELEFQDALSGGSDEEMDVTQHSPAVSRRPRHQEEGNIFKSTKVRFMLSEPRKRRYSCVPYISVPHTAYVTPVRRSTRVGRNRDTPGMKLDEERCFDSPSEVSKQLEFFKDVQIMPNTVLQLT